MQERSITLEGTDPIRILGVNNQKFKIIRSHFPKLKLVARGSTIKAIGDNKEISRFEEKLEKLVQHLELYNELTDLNIEELLGQDDLVDNERQNGDVLVYGNDGLLVKARTPNQQKMVTSISENDMLFAVGPAGTTGGPVPA